jgi:serine protease
MLAKRIGVLMAAAALILIVGLFSPTSGFAQPPDFRVYTGNLFERPLQYAPDRVIVKFAPSVTEKEAGEIAKNFGARIRRKGLGRAFKLLSVPRGRVWEKIEALQRHPAVVFAEPNWIAYATFTPQDPGYDYQWHFDNPVFRGIHMQDAWEINPGGDGNVIVAVADTGIAYENDGSFCRAPDLANTLFVGGYDAVNDDYHPNDDHGHGTHVAGTIAQSTNNRDPDSGALVGVAGIAFNVSLMPVKVLNGSGAGYVSDIAEGIRYAADSGADIINMSFATAYPSTTLQNAIEYAYHEKGVLLVASAGNAGGSQPQYPAAYPEVIAVGATTYDEQLADYSNRGNELCAPGGTDKEDLNGDGYKDMVLQNTFEPESTAYCDFAYWFFAGTSMAAPHVSGLAALVLSQNPTLNHVEIRAILQDTADPLPVETGCGSGLINAHRALQMASGYDSAPVVQIVAPSDGATVSDSVTLQIAASDLEDTPGSLAVTWRVDEGQWQPATINEQTGYYEATWDTTAVDDGAHTLSARAEDSATNISATAVAVTVANQGLPPSVHIADLDAFTRKYRYFWFSYWGAFVDIRVEDQLNAAVGSAKVSIAWSDGSVDSCTTGSSGWCRIAGYQFAGTSQLTLTVTDVVHAALPYEPSLNNDPDGDSDGTRITVQSPF